MSNWDFYQSNINDKIASVYLNLDAEEELSPRHIRLCWFFIKLKVERDDGLSHDDEIESLFEFEDQLIACLCSENLKFVGRVTTAGMRQFYFYGTDDAGFEELCEVFLRSNSSYLYQYNCKDDPERTQYKNVLYPGSLGLKQINERGSNAE